MESLETPSELDAITAEILSHRLWTINDEAAVTVRRMSGSTVATEICDFNTSLLKSNGEAFMVGAYMGPLSMGHDLLVKSILEDYSENPGIGVDDMFICSDPYRGNTHQNDVTVVAPIHWNGELIAWTGVSIHQVDVGGPVFGSQACVGAESIFQEALPMAPMRIVESGILRKDLEEEYLIRSRTRDLNALDLRAKIAANNTAKHRILECVERYSLPVVKAAIESVIQVSSKRLKRRLASLPDGTWRHRGYMDETAGTMHYMQVAVTKNGNQLRFDFRGTGAQAGAIVNCTIGGLMGGILSSILPILCYGMPWCPAAVRSVMEVVTEPGTIVDATWPAGTCKATTAPIAMVNTMVNVCLGKMLAASGGEMSSRSMAPWMAAATVQELAGVDQRGQVFGATMLDPMAGGGGARKDCDGIDTGGVVRAVKLRIANVETYEFRYPLLYLHRRQQQDTGGAGVYRGGVGVSIMFTPHGTDCIPANVMHSINYQAPATVGLFGGYPAATNSMFVLRNSSLWDEISQGRLPVDLIDMEGEPEIVPVMKSSNLRRGDVYRSITCGGGGYGDPLGRDPYLVARDVKMKTISKKEASHTYGVVLSRESTVDAADTESHRRELKRERLAIARSPSLIADQNIEPKALMQSLGGSLRVYDVFHSYFTGCACGYLFAPAPQNYKSALAYIEMPVQGAGPFVNPAGVGADFLFRQFLCPGCGTLVETEVCRPGEPFLYDIETTFQAGNQRRE